MDTLPSDYRKQSGSTIEEGFNSLGHDGTVRSRSRLLPRSSVGGMSNVDTPAGSTDHATGRDTSICNNERKRLSFMDVYQVMLNANVSRHCPLFRGLTL